MLTLDEAWVEDLVQLVWKEMLQIDGGEYYLRDFQKSLSKMRSAALVEVERLVASCRDVPVRLNLSRIPPDMAARDMRGTLVEFHSPLATLLTHHTLKLSLDALVRFVQELDVRPGAVLTLSEFGLGDKRTNSERNLMPAVAAIVIALDRARVLDEFCRRLLRDPWQLMPTEDQVSLQRVLDLCQRYLEWERALNPLSEPVSA